MLRHKKSHTITNIFQYRDSRNSSNNVPNLRSREVKIFISCSSYCTAHVREEHLLTHFVTIVNIECYVLLTPSFGRVCNRRFSFRRATYPSMYVLFVLFSEIKLYLYDGFYHLEPRDKQQSNDRREPTPLVFMEATKRGFHQTSGG